MPRGKYGDADIHIKLFKKCIEIDGKNPSEWRKDIYGNPIHLNLYGKRVKYGWQIDHIKPKSRGGVRSYT